MTAMPKILCDKPKTDTLHPIHCDDIGANPGEHDCREGTLEFLRAVETAGSDETDETATLTVIESSSLATRTWSTLSIHILDDDSLLNMFRLYRQTLLDEDKAENHRIFEGKWVRERWWYKVAHVCQRWRYLILQSPSHFDLCLVCTYRTPVADMLAHSPPLPLVVDHFRKCYEKPGNSEDEAGILIALQQRDRVRRIRLGGHVPDMKRLIEALDWEFPILEYLCITRTTVWNKWWPLPATFQAPRLRHLILSEFDFPQRSPPLTTDIDLLMLTFQLIHVDSYVDFSPDTLLQRLSLIHHLQSFAIDCHGRFDDHVNGQQLMFTHVTLPNLRSFAFSGEMAYLELLLPHITAPHLEKLYISLNIWSLNQRGLSVPHLRQFIITAVDSTGFPSSVVLRFNRWDASVELYPDVGAGVYSVCLSSQDSRLNRQVAFAAHILDDLRPALSEVVHLTLEYRYRESATESTRWQNQLDLTDWRKLLGAFRNVKTLSMHNGLIEEISRSLRWHDGESPLNLLPELDKLECYGRGNASDKFAQFIDARRNAGCSVTLVLFEHFPFPDNEILPSILSPFEASLLI